MFILSLNCHCDFIYLLNSVFSLFDKAQQRECVDSPQGSPHGIHSNSHSLNSGLQPRIPNFSNPLYNGSNENDESEASCSEDNLRVHTSLKNKGNNSINKQAVEPLYEEDVIDGFAIVSFSSYDELEVSWRIDESRDKKFDVNLLLSATGCCGNSR